MEHMEMGLVSQTHLALSNFVLAEYWRDESLSLELG